MENEEGIQELGFNTINIAEKFINGASKLWPLWISGEDIITMYFFADIIKKMYDGKHISKEDLYQLSEQEIINLIINCRDENISNQFKNFMKCDEFIECDENKTDKFCVSTKVKKRYINPLVNNHRAYDISKKAKEKIDNYMNIKMKKYIYINI